MYKQKYVLAAAALTVGMMAVNQIPAFAGEWKSDEKGWWWENDDRTYPVNTWQWLDGNRDGIAECYCFDEAGYAFINTKTPDEFVVNENGAWTVDGVVQQKQVPYETAQSQYPTAEYYQYFMDENVYFDGWGGLAGEGQIAPVKLTKSNYIDHGDYYELKNQILKAANQYDSPDDIPEYWQKEMGEYVARQLPNGKYTVRDNSAYGMDTYVIYTGSIYVSKDLEIEIADFLGNVTVYTTLEECLEDPSMNHYYEGFETDSSPNMMILDVDEKGYVTKVQNITWG